MNNLRALLPAAAGLVLAMLVCAIPAAAQDYPVRPVRVIIRFRRAAAMTWWAA